MKFTTLEFVVFGAAAGYGSARGDGGAARCGGDACIRGGLWRMVTCLLLACSIDWFQSINLYAADKELARPT